MRARGFEARAIPGVPSFCAVAAAQYAGYILVGDENLLSGGDVAGEGLYTLPEIAEPTLDDVRRAIGWPGTKVVMKARRSLADTKRILREEGAFDGAELVEDCGLPGERVYRSLDDVPDRGSYFSTMVVR